MLSPAMATMLAVAHHRRRGRPRRAAARARRRGRRARSTASASTAAARTNDTVLVLANGRAGRGRSARAHRRADRGVRLARRADGARRRRRDEVRARRASSAPAPTPTRASRPGRSPNSQLVQCSLNGDDPYWGRVLSELGASGALHRSRARRHLLQRRHRVPRRHRVRARRGRARRARWPARDIEILCDLHARARRGDGAHHRPLARVHRREPAHVVSAPSSSADARPRRRRGREGAHPRRGAAVHPRVLGQDRRHQVRRPRDGRTRRSPTCSRPTSCSCGSSA